MEQSARSSSAVQTTILIIEDELRSQRLVRLHLEPLGYRVITFGLARGVVAIVNACNPDLIVLDLKLPDGDGFEVCQDIRSFSTVPIIMLSSCRQASEKIRGFQVGADDYVTKPYDSAELSARIEAVLRRRQQRPLGQQADHVCGPLRIDFVQHLVTLNGKEVRLSRTEYRLLEYLAFNAGRTLINDALLTKVWGPEYLGDDSSLHLYISRLRRKLGEGANRQRFIITRPGVGYMMAPEHSELQVAS